MNRPSYGSISWASRIGSTVMGVPASAFTNNSLPERNRKQGKIVMGHNQEDLLGLGKIFSMLSYLALL